MTNGNQSAPAEVLEYLTPEGKEKLDQSLKANEEKDRQFLAELEDLAEVFAEED